MKLIALTLLSFATASSTLSLVTHCPPLALHNIRSYQAEQLTPTERLFKEVSEDFMIDGKPIHPGVLHEFHPDIWKCGGNPVTTVNLSDISCYLDTVNACHQLEAEIEDQHYVIFRCGRTASHCSEECDGYLLYKRMHIQDEGVHLLFFASNTGGTGVDHSYLLVKPIIKTMHKGTTQLTIDDEQIYELGAKEYVALELIGFYEEEPTFMAYEK